jgi:SAM-dependent methyltransferase
MDTSEIYDDMFKTGGFEGVYELPYSQSCYYPLFKQVLSLLQKNYVESILEVGCGTGSFANMILERSAFGYRGFDFSKVAIQKARRRTGKPDLFFVGDATDPLSYDQSRHNYNCIVCTEVLEHIENDIHVVEIWRSGLLCVFTVPNYDSKYHVRYFSDENDVATRYGKYFHIQRVQRIKKPYLTDISIRNYLRHLRWNRYRPRRLLEIIGFGDFGKVGGWFIVSGKKL